MIDKNFELSGGGDFTKVNPNMERYTLCSYDIAANEKYKDAIRLLDEIEDSKIKGRNLFEDQIICEEGSE